MTYWRGTLGISNQDEAPGEDPRNAVKIIFLSWAGIASPFFHKSWRWSGTRRNDICIGCCPPLNQPENYMLLKVSFMEHSSGQTRDQKLFQSAHSKPVTVSLSKRKHICCYVIFHMPLSIASKSFRNMTEPPIFGSLLQLFKGSSF